MNLEPIVTELPVLQLQRPGHGLDAAIELIGTGRWMPSAS